MNYDFFAQHPVNSRQDTAQLSNSMDAYARILLFSQALLSLDKEKIRQEHYKSELNKLVPPTTKNLMASLGVDTPKQLDLTHLPFGSFLISFQFQLARPYISGDDEPLYIIDNPVAKEKVFKMPMIRSTSWKGALRSAIRLQKRWDNSQSALLRLFGTINDNRVSGKTGRLYFYPSFFDKVDLEVINPHDREKKAGTIPVPLESVPIGAQATFTLLYTPLDRLGCDEAKTYQQVFADLQLVAKGLQAMFTLYGFGAKTSSGYGVASENVSGKLITNYPDTGDTLPKPQKPIQPDSLQQFLVQYPNEHFQLKPKAWRKQHKATTSEREAYTQARAANQTYQRKMAEYHTALAEWEKTEHTPPSPTTECTFTNFAELEQVIKEVTQRPVGGGA